MYYTVLWERTWNGWCWRRYRPLQQMFQSCIVRRDISQVCFLLASAKKNAKLPVQQRLLVHTHSEGGISCTPCNERYVSHMCHMCVTPACRARQSCLTPADPYRDGLSWEVHMEEQFCRCSLQPPPHVPDPPCHMREKRNPYRRGASLPLPF